MAFFLIFIREETITFPLKINCQKTHTSISATQLNFMKAATRPQNFLLTPALAVLLGALSYRNRRDSNYEAKRIDENYFSGWGMPLKVFKILQQNVADIKRDFYHILFGLLFQGEVAVTRALMCWTLLSSYYLENWEENSLLKTSCPAQTNQSSPYPFPFGAN